MAPVEITDDYYAILEVPQIATLNIIKKSYRRLAVLLHPDKNPNEADATTSFQCLLAAYETISDPEKRQVYDRMWVYIKHRQRTQQEADKRQAEAAETERKRAAEERLNKEKQSRALQERLRQLEQLRSGYDSSIFEINRVIRRFTTDVTRLQDQDDEEVRKTKERNGWWAYVTSPIYGKTVETEEQKQQRETEPLQRLASKSIREHELRQKEARLRSLKSELQDVNSKITVEKKRNEDEVRARQEGKSSCGRSKKQGGESKNNKNASDRRRGRRHRPNCGGNKLHAQLRKPATLKRPGRHKSRCEESKQSVTLRKLGRHKSRREESE